LPRYVTAFGKRSTKAGGSATLTTDLPAVNQSNNARGNPYKRYIEHTFPQLSGLAKASPMLPWQWGYNSFSLL